MKRIIFLAIVLMFNLGIMSCVCSQNKFDSQKATSEQIKNTLNNTSWVLKRLDVQNRDFVPTDEQKELVLSFNDNYYSSSDGCNGQGGEFNITDNKVSFDKGMSTMRYCGDEMKHLIYSVPFGSVKSIQIKKDELQLLDAEKNVIATYLKKNA
ncbi:META domain-containing protein [Paenimyroides aestuarii]|uniref:META domain-containing protein n=1 Tax=Paenimyroides aestuarii TaxID=2968490 RepID=A0ABY5NQH6_9FLAO|nr:META domain-containing protein [Paenimyroides aestuarii]UUV20815.1 META domain-containing protein [Paenimyroides aestuarii]